MSRAKVKVTQDPQKPIAVEIIAQSIVDMSAAMKKLNDARLTRGALITLLADDTKLGKGVIATVLMALSDLERTWLKAVK